MGFLRCVIYIAVLGVCSNFFMRLLPDSCFQYDRFPYRPLPFEQGGTIYRKIGIQRWKSKVPDMSKVLRRLIPAKAVDRGVNSEGTALLVKETCIAELTHIVLSILGLGCLWLWPGFGGVAVFSVYFLLGNLPFCLIQRYNRPKYLRLLKKIQNRKTETTNESSDTKLQ